MAEGTSKRDPLQEYKRKRERAMHHFRILRESVEAFTGQDRELVRGDFDTAASQYTFEVPLQRHPADWTLALGDFSYNARACLDYLIRALVLSAEPVERRTSEFPIYGIDRVSWQDIDEWWERDPEGRIRRQLRGTPAGTKDALKTLQPFFGVPRVDPTRHPLFALRELSNRDKHRRLNLLVRRASVEFVDRNKQRLFAGPPPTARISDHGEGDAYIVSLAVRRRLDTDIYLLPQYNVALNEPPELLGNLIPTLSEINAFINGRVAPVVAALL